MLPDTLNNSHDTKFQGDLKWEKPSHKEVTDPARIIPMLAELDIVTYDQFREKMAKSLGIRTTTLDKEVGKARNGQIHDEGKPLVGEVEPWGEPVNGNELFTEIETILNRYVILPDGAAVALTLWAVGTYCFDAFRIWPKLCITSPEKRCGKSRLIETLSPLCNRALVASNISPSAVFRVIDAWKPTLMIDEADTFLNGNEELRGVINSGHTKSTAFVIRNVGDSHEPAHFSTWAPMVIAMIKHPPDTIMDRSIMARLRRKLPGEFTQKLSLTFGRDCEPIRQKLKRWANDHVGKLQAARPTLPPCNNDRSTDNWTPLFAISETVGGDWPEQVKTSFKLLVKPDEDDESIGPLILQDIQTIFTEKKWLRVHTSELTTELINLEERPWSDLRHGRPLSGNSLARLLKPFGIKSKQISIGNINRNGYELEGFSDAFKRYLPATPPIQNSKTLEANNDTAYSQNQNSRTDQSLEFQKSPQPTSGQGSRVLEVGTGGSGEESKENQKIQAIF